MQSRGHGAIIKLYHHIHFLQISGLMWVPFSKSQSIVAFRLLNWTRDYSDVTMSAMASQITSLTIVNSTVHSGADQRKYQSSASLAFVRGIYRWSVNSPHKGPVTREKFPFDDVIMVVLWIYHINQYWWSWTISFDLLIFSIFLEIVYVFRSPTYFSQWSKSSCDRLTASMQTTFPTKSFK